MTRRRVLMPLLAVAVDLVVVLGLFAAGAPEWTAYVAGVVVGVLVGTVWALL